MADETKPEAKAAASPTLITIGKPPEGAKLYVTESAIHDVLNAVDERLAAMLAEATKVTAAEHKRLSAPTKAPDGSDRHAPPTDRTHFQHMQLAAGELRAVQGGIGKARDAWGRFLATAARAQEGLAAHKKESGA